MLTLLVALSVASPLCERTQLSATLSDDLRQVSGEVRCLGAGSASARVAAYPRTLRREVGVDDVSRPWLYPRGFSAADMRLWQGAGQLGGEAGWLDADPALPLRFETTVPARNGVFGRARSAAYLLAGWHPVFAGRDVLEDGVIEYDIRLPAGVAGFVGATPVGLDGARRLAGRFVGRYLPIFAARGVRASRRDGDVVLRAAEPRGLRDLTSGRDELALDDLFDTLRLGREAVPGAPPLLVVVAPLRSELCVPFDGGLAVSDRAFHVARFETLLRFHRRSVWRAELAALWAPRLAGREAELPTEIVADAVASAAAAALDAAVYPAAVEARDLLETFAVIPEIDSLLLAPQIPFPTTYFDAVDERGGLPPGPLDPSPLPRGKLLYEKLADELGEEAARALLEDYARGARPLFDTVASAAGDEVAARLRAFLGPYPDIGYALGEVSARAGGVTVRIEASGPAAATLVEPITVAVTDAAGVTRRATRLGPGVLAFDEVGGPVAVEIDPDGRLSEGRHPGGFGPRFDNRTPPRWRFLLNNITGLVAVTNRQVTASADFTLRRIHDLRYRFDFAVAASPEAYGFGAAASYGFGRELTPLRLAHRVGATIGGDRLTPERGHGEHGFQLSSTAFYSYDTRLSPYSSYAGEGLSARLDAAAGEQRAGRYRFARAALSAFRLFQLSSYHALLARVRLDEQLGAPPPQEQLRLGGRYTGGRGYEPDEARGERRAVLSLEDRHALAVDTRSDLFGALTVTGVEGAFFADAVYLPGASSCGRDVLYDVGYGVRVLVELLNVSPSSFALDVGVPLSRCAGVAGRAPVSIYLAFVQSFLVF